MELKECSISDLRFYNAEEKPQAVGNLLEIYIERYDYVAIRKLITSEYKKYIQIHQYPQLIKMCCRHDYYMLFRCIINLDQERLINLNLTGALNIPCYWSVAIENHSLNMLRLFTTLENEYGRINLHNHDDNDIWYFLSDANAPETRPHMIDMFKFLVSLEAKYGTYAWNDPEYHLLIKLIEKGFYRYYTYPITRELLANIIHTVVDEKYEVDTDKFSLIPPMIFGLLENDKDLAFVTLDIIDTLSIYKIMCIYDHLYDCFTHKNAKYWQLLLKRRTFRNLFVRYVHRDNNEIFRYSADESRHLIVKASKQLEEYDWIHVPTYNQYLEFIKCVATFMCYVKKIFSSYTEPGMDNVLFDQIESYIIPNLDA